MAGAAARILFSARRCGLAFWAGRRWMGPIGATIFVLLCSFAQFISYFPVDVKHYFQTAVDSGRGRQPPVLGLPGPGALWFANGPE